MNRFKTSRIFWVAVAFCLIVSFGLLLYQNVLADMKSSSPPTGSSSANALNDARYLNGSVSDTFTGGRLRINAGSEFWCDTCVFERSPWYDVRAWGAIPDDGDTDGPELQTLFSSLPDGAEVFMPAGKYIGSLDSDSRVIYVTSDSVTIRGAGRDATRLVLGPNQVPSDGYAGKAVGDDGMVVVDTGVKGFTIENMTIDGDSEATGNDGDFTGIRILPSNENPTIRNVKIKELPHKGRGITLNDFQSATRTDGAVIDRVIIENLHKGIDLWKQDNPVIKNSRFIDNSQDAMEVNAADSFAIRDNYCRNPQLHCLEISGTLAPGSGDGLISGNISVGSNFEAAIGNSADFDLKKAKRLVISGNECTESQGICFRIGSGSKLSPNNLVSNNRVDSAPIGIVINGANNMVLGNKVDDTDSESLRIGSKIGNLIANNSFENPDQLGSGVAAVVLDSSSNIINANKFLNADTEFSGESDELMGINFMNDGIPEAGELEFSKLTALAGAPVSGAKYVDASDSIGANRVTHKTLADTPTVQDGQGVNWVCASNSTLACDEGDRMYSINPAGGGATEHYIEFDRSAETAE